MAPGAIADGAAPGPSSLHRSPRTVNRRGHAVTERNGLEIGAFEPMAETGQCWCASSAVNNGDISGNASNVPRAGINHLCMNMENFRPDAVIKVLESYGIKPRGTPGGTPGPLVHYISMRMADRGGAKEGTPELYFTDPDGLLIQIQDVSYCGGSGVIGNICI
jgi:catechol 2,3-dioxygenase-like lactoylglutathione lyase family enzyme